MKVYLSHISALFFWRQRSVEDFALLPRSRKRALTDCCESTRESNEHTPLSHYFGEGRKHVLVPSQALAVNRDGYCYHLWSHELPPRALVELDGRTFVSSPEFCFLQMAQVLSVAGLVALGLELCGIYRLQPDAPAESNCASLTTPTRLNNFIENCKGRRGHKKASRAIKWVLAGSASPRETVLYERLCLPHALRGYAFPPPSLNGEMSFNDHQRELAERSTSYGDLYWPEKDVSVEYFGRKDHTGSYNMSRDAKRNNALTSRETKFYTITWDIYDNMESFDAIAREIARALGVRIRYRYNDLAFRNWQLAQELREQEQLTYPEAHGDEAGE